jgi:WD40 repeat protein
MVLFQQNNLCRRLIAAAALSLAAMAFPLVGSNAQTGPAHTPQPISYHKQIWPLLQAKCQGCHQPASAGGKLVVTSFAQFTKGGEHGAVFLAGDPGKSALFDYLTGIKTLMPKNGPALPAADISLFKRWIAEGAKDDTPATIDPISEDHPPVYHAPPVITALAYSPDGKTLAVSGYREILLHYADGSGLRARLVGKAQKILSLVYTSDGAMLCAVGGTPALFGEIQFWNTADNRQVNAVQTTFDTVFGASLSPDNKELAFGGADNSVRVVTVPDGKQIMQLDNHSDWVFATTFAMDAKKQLNILSAGRDQAIKLTLVNGGSFIDDINTHYTALRCLVRNPKAEQVLCGGDDGIPRLYKIFRTEVRTMNQEDHNLVTAYEKQPSGITALAFSADGKYIAVGTDVGSIHLYSTADGKPVCTLIGLSGAAYALAFSPNGEAIATAGFDGTVRIYNAKSGSLQKQFVPVPITPLQNTASAEHNKPTSKTNSATLAQHRSLTR